MPDDRGEPMKYMLLIYGNDETWAALKADGMDGVMERHRVLTEETKAAGEFVMAQGLTTLNARIVQVHDAVPTVTDGPFTESKEVLAGFYLLDCSLERATEVAARLPEAPYSPIEIREVPDEE
jgi:hypothetical protein